MVDGLRLGALIGALTMALSAGAVAAHPGPLDSDGCHFSEAEGYHCPDGPPPAPEPAPS